MPGCHTTVPCWPLGLKKCLLQPLCCLHCPLPGQQQQAGPAAGRKGCEGHSARRVAQRGGRPGHAGGGHPRHPIIQRVGAHVGSAQGQWAGPRVHALLLPLRARGGCRAEAGRMPAAVLGSACMHAPARRPGYATRGACVLADLRPAGVGGGAVPHPPTTAACCQPGRVKAA